jgi:hypothetical protein
MTGLVWGKVQEEITEVVSRTPHDIPEVVTQLADLQVLLNKVTPDDSDNPIADFNHLYLTITSTILEHRSQEAFHDREFLTLLDVEFAKRYFNALRLWGELSPETPQAWMVLFRQLRNPGVHSLPAAVAGVNAHVNYDLPFALISTWRQLPSDPSVEPQHQDYQHINDVFFEKIPKLRRGYLSAWQLIIDRLNGPVDDWLDDRAVELARDVAWVDGERLWAMRDNPDALRRANTSLDHHAALIGWALLSPFGALLQ